MKVKHREVKANVQCKVEAILTYAEVRVKQHYRRGKDQRSPYGLHVRLYVQLVPGTVDRTSLRMTSTLHYTLMQSVTVVGMK